jgi:phosphatidylglycerol:prolipoprotein diacylglycerol transferase
MSKNYRKLIWVIFLSILSLTFIFLISKVFSGNLILSQGANVGPFFFRFYGLCLSLAVGTAYLFAVKRASKYSISESQAENILFVVLVCGFVGARLYHVVSSVGYYSQNFSEIFKVWHGGLSIYGAVLGSFLGLAIYLKFYRTLNTQPSTLIGILNWLTPPLLLGQIIGRFGNFFNYEAFGYPTNQPWKMFVPETFRPENFLQNSFFHPWFLYEVIFNLLILFIVLKMEKRGNFSNLFFTYLLLYNAVKLILELIRIDSTFIGIFRLNFIVSLVLVIISSVILIKDSYKIDKVYKT